MSEPTQPEFHIQWTIIRWGCRGQGGPYSLLVCAAPQRKGMDLVWEMLPTVKLSVQTAALYGMWECRPGVWGFGASLHYTVKPRQDK